MILFSFCECHWLIPWLLPFILGILIGLIIRARLMKRIAELEEENRSVRDKLSEAEADLKDCRAKRAALDSELTLLKQIQREKEEALKDSKAAESTQVPPSAIPSASSEPDNLTKIDGIGPKIEKLLNSDGVHTFAQLAQADLDQLSRVLEEAGPRFRLANPSSWKEQAQMASEGRWEDLKSYVKRMKADK